MNKRHVFLILVAALAVGGTSCRSAKTPKENPNVATGVETDFKQRWVEKRTAELTAAGTEAAAARAQANQEFATNFSYLRATDPKRR